MPSELARFQAAQDRISAQVLRGGRPGIMDLAVIIGFSDGSVSISALERLSTVATVADVKAQFLADAVKIRVRLQLWPGFERTVRMMRRVLRGMPREPSLTRPAIVVRPGDTGGVWSLYLRDLALAYGRYLWKTGRTRYAQRLLMRVSLADGISKHLARTEMGLLALEAGRTAEAINHFVESLEVPNEASLVLRYSLELQQALEARQVRSNRFSAARGKLQRRRFPSSNW